MQPSAAPGEVYGAPREKRLGLTRPFEVGPGFPMAAPPEPELVFFAHFAAGSDPVLLQEGPLREKRLGLTRPFEIGPGFPMAAPPELFSFVSRLGRTRCCCTGLWTPP